MITEHLPVGTRVTDRDREGVIVKPLQFGTLVVRWEDERGGTYEMRSLPSSLRKI